MLAAVLLVVFALEFLMILREFVQTIVQEMGTFVEFILEEDLSSENINLSDLLPFMDFPFSFVVARELFGRAGFTE